MSKFNSYYNNEQEPKWETVLFTGDFNPITRNEYSRIVEFNNKIIKEQFNSKFSDSVDLGVLVDHNYDDETRSYNEKRNYELTLEDKKFINEKIFGLKSLPINFNELLYSKNNEVETLAEEFGKKFHNSNILIVIRPEEKIFMRDFENLEPVFKKENLNVGFMVYEATDYIQPKEIRKMPCNHKIIKSIVLLNSEMPDPQGLKLFAHKHKVSEYVNEIRNIYNRFNGNYEQIFQFMFPRLKINEDDSEVNILSNSKIMMELLKRMYLKNQQDENNLL